MVYAYPNEYTVGITSLGYQLVSPPAAAAAAAPAISLGASSEPSPISEPC